MPEGCMPTFIVVNIVKVVKSMTLTVCPTGAKLLLPKFVTYALVPAKLITMSNGPENPFSVSISVLSLTRIFETDPVPGLPS